LWRLRVTYVETGGKTVSKNGQERGTGLKCGCGKLGGSPREANDEAQPYEFWTRSQVQDLITLKGRGRQRGGRMMGTEEGRSIEN